MVVIKQKLQNLKKSKFVIILLLICVAVFVWGTISVQAVDDDEASDYSFYTLASNMSMALSTVAADTENGNAVVSMFYGLSPSSAGGILGYPDKTTSRGVSGLFGAYNSNSSISYSYAQLSKGNYSLIGSVLRNNVFSTYCVLGATLADMGIDKTAPDTITDPTRQMIGISIRLFYEAAHIVSVLFKFIINFLQKINPFQFFSKADDYIKEKGIDTSVVDFGGLEVHNEESDFSGFFMPLIEAVSNLYSSLYEMGSMVLLVFFGVMVISLFMQRITATQSRFEIIRKYVFRAAFIVFGIPLLGCSYTVILDMVSKDMAGKNSPAAKVIASTFVLA